MAALSAFSPYILPEVAGCPTPMIEGATRDGCRRFSEDTWIITTDVTLATVANTQSYAVTPLADTELLAVKTVSIDGAKPISPIPEDTEKRYVQTPGDPTGYWFKDDLLWLFPTPQSAASVVVQAVLRPTITAATVNDKYVEYRDSISAWAKYQLMSMVGQPWSNTQEAEYYYRLYRQVTSEQRVREARGRTSIDLRVRPNFF